FVVKVDISNEGNIWDAFADFFQGVCSVVIGNGEANHFTTGAHHLFDLRDSSINVGSVSLGHRLHHDRRATADLNVLNFYRARLSHNFKSRVLSSEFRVRKIRNPKHGTRNPFYFAGAVAAGFSDEPFENNFKTSLEITNTI